MVSGCREPTSSGIVAEGEATRPSEAEFAQAIDLLSKIEQFEADPVLKRSANLLNRWIDSYNDVSPWRRDPLTSRIPQEFRRLGLFEKLNDRKFSIHDLTFLQAQINFRDIVSWVTAQELDKLSQQRVDQTQVGSSKDQSDLKTAIQLFDWTIRNIQLEPMPEIPGSAQSGLGGQSNEARLRAITRGVKGPGYWRIPHHVLQFGRGDALQRAAIFMSLCKQANLTTLMLAVDQPPLPQPWVSAVLIGDDLYLFDAELGLPLPGPGGKGVATLAQIVADPSLLEPLDIRDPQTDQFLLYRVQKKDVKNLAALVYASLFHLSERMRILELSLLGDDKMALSTNPSAILQKLSQLKILKIGQQDPPEGLVQRVALWMMPFEAVIYRDAMITMQRINPTVGGSYFAEERMFMLGTPLVRGRRNYFRGKFEAAIGATTMKEANKAGQEPGFLLASMSEGDIRAISQSSELQTMLGLTRQATDSEIIWQDKIQQLQQAMRTSRSHAGFWMGLLQYESERPQAATYWFKNRTLKNDKEGPWSTGARYSLGRSLEKLGRLQEAQQIYRSQEGVQSPQRQGELLRAQWLEEVKEEGGTRKEG